MIRTGALPLATFLALATLASGQSAGLPQKPQDLFKIDRIWSVHLSFTADQWQAMQPIEDIRRAGIFGPGPAGARGPGGPGGPGVPGGRRMGLSMLLAPGFLKADINNDDAISAAEFRALAANWFTTWGKGQAEPLTAAQFRAGLDAAFPFPSFGGPGAGGPGGGAAGPRLVGEEGKRNGVAAASGVEFSYVHGKVNFEGVELDDIAARYKGNGTFMASRNNLKKSFKLDLNKYNKQNSLAGLFTVNLHSAVTDASWMNEVLAYRLFRDAGVPSPRTAYARVSLTVPGTHDNRHVGLYSLVENIDDDFAAAHFQSRKGAIFKPVTPALFHYDGDDWKKYNQAYDPKTKLTPAQKARVLAFAKLVTSGSDEEFGNQLPSFLDLDQFARFMAVTVYLSNQDSILSMGQNYYMYLHPETNKFQFMPWDHDHSFGQFPMGGSQQQREDLSIRKPWQRENRFLERVMRVEQFQKLYMARMTEFSQTLFAPARITAQVDELAKALRPAVEAESAAQLALFDKVIAGEPVNPGGFGQGPSMAIRTPGQGPGPGPG